MSTTPPPPPPNGRANVRYLMAAAIVAALAAGAAFGLPREAEARWEIGFVRYRIDPGVVDGWSTTDADVKAAAKALRWQNMAACETAAVDTTGDGNADSQVGQTNCRGTGGRHIYYDGGSRDNHPATRGFTHSSGHSSAASGGNPRFTDAGIDACLVAKPLRGNGCTFDELVTYHTNNNLGGY